MLWFLGVLSLGAGAAQADTVAAVKIQAVVLPTDADCLAVEHNLRLLQEKYGKKIKIELLFLIERNPQGRYTSRLGRSDLLEARRQALIRRTAPKKFWDYLDARNGEMYSPIWENAAQLAKLDIDSLRRHSEGKHPEAGLFKLDEQVLKKYPIAAIPTIIMNGEQTFAGSVGLAQLDFEIQRRLKKKEFRYSMRLLYDPKALQPQRQTAQDYIKKFVVGVQFAEEPAGAEMESRLVAAGVKEFPALLVDRTFSDSYYSRYIPVRLTQTAKDEFYCLSLPVERDTLIGRPVMPGHLTVVMQTQCPAAVSLIKQLLEKNKKDQLKVELDMPLFMLESEPAGNSVENDEPQSEDTDAQADALSGSSGSEELEEDVRQLAIQKYYPDKYWSYVEHLYAGSAAAWPESLKYVNIDINGLENLAAQEKDKLLLENDAKVDDLPLRQAPVLLVNNRYLITDINEYLKPEGIRIDSVCEQ